MDIKKYFLIASGLDAIFLLIKNARGKIKVTLHISKKLNKAGKQYIEEELYKFNLTHFPKDLGGRYEEICLYLKDNNGTVHGGILSEICWNWLEIHTFMIDEAIRKSGYGTKLLAEIEKIAVEKECDFIKEDTLSFQSLDSIKRMVIKCTVV